MLIRKNKEHRSSKNETGGAASLSTPNTILTRSKEQLIQSEFKSTRAISSFRVYVFFDYQSYPIG